MSNTTQMDNNAPAVKNKDSVLEFKRRMLKWSNPVEYVNNMYGSHPDDENNDYFDQVFA